MSKQIILDGKTEKPRNSRKALSAVLNSPNKFKFYNNNLLEKRLDIFFFANKSKGNILIDKLEKIWFYYIYDYCMRFSRFEVFAAGKVRNWSKENENGGFLHN